MSAFNSVSCSVVWKHGTTHMLPWCFLHRPQLLVPSQALSAGCSSADFFFAAAGALSGTNSCGSSTETPRVLLLFCLRRSLSGFLPLGFSCPPSSRGGLEECPGEPSGDDDGGGGGGGGVRSGLGACGGAVLGTSGCSAGTTSDDGVFLTGAALEGPGDFGLGWAGFPGWTFCTLEACSGWEFSPGLFNDTTPFFSFGDLAWCATSSLWGSLVGELGGGLSSLIWLFGLRETKLLFLTVGNLGFGFNQGFCKNI